MKMSDVFKLPMVCEDGDGFIYSKDLRHSIQFDDSDTYMMDHKKAVTHAINNHDRMQDEIAELREALQSLVDVEHERGGSLGVSGQFYYKVPESVFNSAKQLLNK